MPRKKIDFDLVRQIGRALPGVQDSTMYGAPAVKLRKKLLACPAIHRSAEPNTLAVRIDFDERDELIEADPDIYYLKDHYADYPVVLVRMSRISADALRDLLAMSWRFASKTKPTNRRGPRRRTR
jgi:hypothetical protein